MYTDKGNVFVSKHFFYQKGGRVYNTVHCRVTVNNLALSLNVLIFNQVCIIYHFAKKNVLILNEMRNIYMNIFVCQ